MYEEQGEEVLTRHHLLYGSCNAKSNYKNDIFKEDVVLVHDES